MIDSPFVFILFVYGLAFGSFLNVLADRLSMEQTIGGRSHCDYCKKTLRWNDLIPVISYVLLKGKCRYCHKKLSVQYPLVELVTGVVFVLSWYYSPFTLPILRIFSIALSSVLLVILVADLRYQIIPDEMQVALVGIAMLMILFSGATLTGILLRLGEGILVMLPILILFLLTRGRGMGFGDVKLAFGIGVLLGVYRGGLALYIAFLTGAIVGVGLLASRRTKMKNKIAFGPFLVVGIVCLFYFQKQVFFVVDKLFLTR
ncbi:prepilin peptidase [Candidatus Microgenomates bacterium]|nr:prepilin peptidase [Candidatus Microgenomates bacterium]